MDLVPDWQRDINGEGEEGDRAGLIRLLSEPLSLSQVEHAYRAHINPTIFRLLRFSGSAQVEKRGHGFWIEDHAGTQHLDCMSGFGVFSFGHAHPEIINAVTEQLKSMPLASRVLLNEPLARLSTALAQITPGKLSHSFICNSGSEAVEAALKIALAGSKRREVISMSGAYHGKTFGALSASSRSRYREQYDLLPGFTQVQYGDPKSLLERVSEQTAAIIVEPIQGENGIVLPPPGYLREVRQICDFYGALLILDEVQTGMGRTGRNFACEWENVEPDLLCLGKALGGGVMPVAAVVGTEKAFTPLMHDPLLHTSTFGGNPLACVAALSALKILIRDNLAARSEKTGGDMLFQLREIGWEYPDLISEVRGRGLMIGLEMKRPSIVGSVVGSLRKRRILVCQTLNENRVLRLQPPLMIPKDLVDLLLAGLRESLAETRALFSESGEF